MASKPPGGRRIGFDLEVWLSSLFVVLSRYFIDDQDIEGISMILSPAFGHFASKFANWSAGELNILRQQWNYERNLKKHIKDLEAQKATASPARLIEIEAELADLRKRQHDNRIEKLEFQKPDYKKK